jgi:DNA-binding GntR family transcriptional regulator
MDNLQHIIAAASQQYRGTADIVAQALRQAILGGVFQDGQALRQDELAARFSISKIPVREALRRLEAEGLVIFYPNRGAVVASLSAAEAQEIAEMRVALETLALRLALPRLSARDLSLAAIALDDLDQAADVARWGALNWTFHQSLYTPSQRPRLLATIERLHTAVDRYMRVVLASMEHQARSQQEHRALLAACEKRDLAAAIDILTHHIAGAGALLVTHLEQKAMPAGPGG